MTYQCPSIPQPNRALRTFMRPISLFVWSFARFLIFFYFYYIFTVSYTQEKNGRFSLFLYLFLWKKILRNGKVKVFSCFIIIVDDPENRSFGRTVGCNSLAIGFAIYSFISLLVGTFTLFSYFFILFFSLVCDKTYIIWCGGACLWYPGKE